MLSTAPAPIEDLLQRMQEFRGRTILQVQGQPALAMNAFLVSGLTASHHPEPVQEGWSRVAKRVFERFLRPKSKPIGLVETQDRIATSKPGKSPAERQWVEDIDRTLLDYAVQQQWLTKAHAHAEVTDEMGLREPSAVPAMGKTFIVSNAQGDYDNFLPKESASGNERTCMRWFILLHEAAHLEFETVQAPFNPTPGRLGKQCVTALNDWVFEVVHQGRRQHREVFNECFADVYGAMMLLKATHFSKEAFAALAQVHSNRAADRVQIDQERVADGEEGAMKDHHCTDFALRHAFSNAATWQDMSAQDLRNAALRYASDGFLDFVEPTRLTPSGEGVGELLRRDFSHPTLTSADHMYYLATFANVAFSEFVGEGSNDWFECRLKGHPAQDMMCKLWNQAGPDVMQSLRQQPASFKFDVESLLPSALRKMDQLVYATVRAHLEDVHFQPTLARVQKIYEQDNRLIVQGLSRATFSAEPGAVVSQWRSNRPAHQTTIAPVPAVRPV